VPATAISGSAAATTLLVAFTALMRNGGIEDLQLFGGNIESFNEVGGYEDGHDDLLVVGVGILDNSLLLGGEARQQLDRQSSLTRRGCPFAQSGRARDVGSTCRMRRASRTLDGEIVTGISVSCSVRRRGRALEVGYGERTSGLRRPRGLMAEMCGRLERHRGGLRRGRPRVLSRTS